MKKYFLFSILMVLAALSMQSCEKDKFSPTTPEYGNDIVIDRSPSFELPSNKDGDLLKQAIIELTDLSKDVFKDFDAQAELFYLANVDFYSDQYVSLWDVMHPGSGTQYQKSGMPGSIIGTIKGLIIKAITNDESGAYDHLLYYLNKSYNNAPKEAPYFDRAELYFYIPYVKDYQLSFFQPTLVPAIIDADKAVGYELKGNTYEEVMVDDDYAESYATVIITGADPETVAALGPPSPPDGPDDPDGPGPGNPDNPDDPDDPCDNIHKVHLGWIRLTEQMDALISFTNNGGPSEIMIGRIDGYLEETSDGNITLENFKNLTRIERSRRDIRKKKWGWFGSIIWDSNWECDNYEQGFVVYEEDTESEVEVGGSLSTRIQILGGARVDAEVEFGVTVKTQDEIMVITERGFEEFFTVNQMDNGAGLREGQGIFSGQDYAVYTGSSGFSYTLPHIIL